MIAGAVAQFLVAGGVSAAAVSVGQFGSDYVRGGAAQFAVSDEGGPDHTVLGDAGTAAWYDVRLQMRARADDAIGAVEALQVAFDLVRGALGETLVWSNPSDVGEETRSYQFVLVSPQQRPTWFPSPTPGEVATCNFRLRVRPA